MKSEYGRFDFVCRIAIMKISQGATCGLGLDWRKMMNPGRFYQEIEHIPVSWKDHQVYVPLFYRDFKLMSVNMLASVKKVRALLPSRRLKPYRITPGRTIVAITAYQYRDTDLGPYNEVSVSVPVTMDRNPPMFTGILRKPPANPKAFILHLPVTTELARALGVEMAGYPKFIADIEFVEENDWVTCTVAAEERYILSFSGRKLALDRAPRYCLYPITYRNDYLLRSEFLIASRQMGSSSSAQDVQIVFGDHPIAEEMKHLDLGRVVAYQYCPQAQGILTPVLESCKAERRKGEVPCL